MTSFIWDVMKNEELKSYCWAVPCVIANDKVFLKTIYPSRKLTKKYLEDNRHEKD